MVGDRDRSMTESGCRHHQLVRMRSPAQKREIGGDLQLRVHHDSAGQEKMPWTNQRGG